MIAKGAAVVGGFNEEFVGRGVLAVYQVECPTRQVEMPTYQSHQLLLLI